MHALERDVLDAIWQTIEGLFPDRHDTRSAAIDHASQIGVILNQLVTGGSWVDIESILDSEVSDTTLRTRRDE